MNEGTLWQKCLVGQSDGDTAGQESHRLERTELKPQQYLVQSRFMM